MFMKFVSAVISVFNDPNVRRVAHSSGGTIARHVTDGFVKGTFKK